MDHGYMSSKLYIHFLVCLIKKKEDQIKSRKECSWKIDVLVGLQFLIISSINWICCCQNRCSSIQTCGDTSLSNRNSLLLHNLMNISSISFVHLIELINTANTGISQDQGSSLENNFSGSLVLENSCCKTNTRRSLSGCVDTSWSESRNMF
jgi:hypothetical protein